MGANTGRIDELGPIKGVREVLQEMEEEVRIVEEGGSEQKEFLSSLSLPPSLCICFFSLSVCSVLLFMKTRIQVFVGVENKYLSAKYVAKILMLRYVVNN